MRCLRNVGAGLARFWRDVAQVTPLSQASAHLDAHGLQLCRALLTRTVHEVSEQLLIDTEVGGHGLAVVDASTPPGDQADPLQVGQHLPHPVA